MLWNKQPLTMSLSLFCVGYLVLYLGPVLMDGLYTWRDSFGDNYFICEWLSARDSFQFMNGNRHSSFSTWICDGAYFMESFSLEINSFRVFLLSILAMGFCTYSSWLQEEASMMVAEQDTVLWTLECCYKSFIAMFS